MDSIIISLEEKQKRLDVILAQRFQGIKSRTYFQMLLAEGHVLLNGSQAKKKDRPEEGDEVQVHFILTPEIDLIPESIPLNILYEDEHLIAVNKPVGMVVHPAVGNWTGTFVNALLHHCKNLPSASSLRPGIVHRLDKDTSGVLLAAKTAETQSSLIDLFAKRLVRKDYIAICLGNPGNVRIEQPIGRHPVHRQMMTTQSPRSKPAITICTSRACDGNLSLVELELITGRTHQIRVHLKHQGTPILGDPVYGNVSTNAKYKVQRQLLHAHRMQFVHPVTQKALLIEAPLPADIDYWKMCIK